MSANYYETVEDGGPPDSGELDTVLRVRSAAATEGPWGPGLQHGGPPNALAVACAERALAASTERSDLRPMRLSSDFVGPVPVAELEVRSRVVRAARSAALVHVVIAAGGRDCLHSRVWFVRDTDTGALVDDLPPAVDVPTDLPALDTDFAYGRSIEWRFVDGAMRRPGPASAWSRPLLGVLDDYEFSGLARAVLVADSGNGLSAELNWDEWGFLNVDLDVHLARPLQGEWVLMRAATQLSAHGSALARSTLSDVHGEVGGGMQTLVVAPRPR